MRIFQNCCLLFPASFKLAYIDSFHMLHLLPWVITFNIVGYINERELNIWCGVPSICNSLHIELHLICSIVCCTLPCHASLNRTCIILVCASWLVCVGYLLCCVLLFRCCFFGLVPITSCCEDSFVYVRLSSSWTRSSSLRDFRQDGRYPGSHYYHCYASCFVLPLCCATYHLLSSLPICHVSL